MNDIDEKEGIEVYVNDFTGTEIISINGLDKIDELQKKYPKIEVIVGKATADDKPVKLDLLEMENSKKEIIDAATETVLGKRIDKLEKPSPFPFPAVMFLVGAMSASTIWLYLGKFF